MNKKIVIVLITSALAGSALVGCGKKETTTEGKVEVNTSDEAAKSTTEEDPDYTADDAEILSEDTHDSVEDVMSDLGYTQTDSIDKDGVNTAIFETEDGSSIAIDSADDLSGEIYASEGLYWQIGYVGNTEYRVTTDSSTGEQKIYSVEWTDADGQQHHLSAPDGIGMDEVMQMLYSTADLSSDIESGDVVLIDEATDAVEEAE